MLLVAGIWGLAVRVSVAMQGDLERLLSQQLSATVRLATDTLDQDVEMRSDALKRIASRVTPEMLGVSLLQRYLEDKDVVSETAHLDIVFVNGNGIIVADYPRIPQRWKLPASGWFRKRLRMPRTTRAMASSRLSDCPRSRRDSRR